MQITNGPLSKVFLVQKIVVDPDHPSRAPKTFGEAAHEQHVYKALKLPVKLQSVTKAVTVPWCGEFNILCMMRLWELAVKLARVAPCDTWQSSKVAFKMDCGNPDMLTASRLISTSDFTDLLKQTTVVSTSAKTANAPSHASTSQAKPTLDSEIEEPMCFKPSKRFRGKQSPESTAASNFPKDKPFHDDIFPDSIGDEDEANIGSVIAKSICKSLGLASGFDGSDSDSEFGGPTADEWLPNHPAHPSVPNLGCEPLEPSSSATGHADADADTAIATASKKRSFSTRLPSTDYAFIAQILKGRQAHRGFSCMLYVVC